MKPRKPKKDSWKAVVIAAESYVEAKKKYDVRDTNNRLHDDMCWAFDRLCAALEEYERGKRS